jgi:hypothetical protein
VKQPQNSILLWAGASSQVSRGTIVEGWAVAGKSSGEALGTLKPCGGNMGQEWCRGSPESRENSVSAVDKAGLCLALTS